MLKNLVLLLLFSADAANAFVAFHRQRQRFDTHASTTRCRALFDPVSTTEEMVSALAGGTVGVLGSVIAIEAKKMKVQKSKECPYCNGRGSLVCAGCLSSDSKNCAVCYGQGLIPCENCKGRGRFIPTMLDRRASRDPETAAEDVGLL